MSSEIYKSRSSLSRQSAVHLGIVVVVFFTSEQFSAAELFFITTTKLLQRRPDIFKLLMAGAFIQIQALLLSIPVPYVFATSPAEELATSATDVLDGYTRNVPSGLLNVAQYRRINDWTCDPCSALWPSSHHQPLLQQVNQSATTAHSTFYS